MHTLSRGQLPLIFFHEEQVISSRAKQGTFFLLFLYTRIKKKWQGEKEYTVLPRRQNNIVPLWILAGFSSSNDNEKQMYSWWSRKKSINTQIVMLNLFQHLVVSTCYKTLKRVQGDTIGLFTTSSLIHSSSNPPSFLAAKPVRSQIIFKSIICSY